MRRRIGERRGSRKGRELAEGKEQEEKKENKGEEEEEEQLQLTPRN